MHGKDTPGMHGKDTPGMHGKDTPGMHGKATPGMHGKAAYASFRGPPLRSSVPCVIRPPSSIASASSSSGAHPADPGDVMSGGRHRAAGQGGRRRGRGES